MKGKRGRNGKTEKGERKREKWNLREREIKGEKKR